MSLVELEARLNDVIHDLSLLAGRAEARRLVKMLMDKHCGIEWSDSMEPHTQLTNEADYWLSICDEMPAASDQAILQLDGGDLLGAPYAESSARGAASPLSPITPHPISNREQSPRQQSLILPTIDPSASMLHVTPLRCISPTGSQSRLMPAQELSAFLADRRPWSEASDTGESLPDKGFKLDSLSVSLVNNMKLCKRCNSDPTPQVKKKRLSEHYRSDLVEFLGRHWEYLQSTGLFGQLRSDSSPLVLNGQPVCKQLRGYYYILREMEGMHDLHPCRRAVAEYRTLQGYNQIVREVREGWAVGSQVRRGASAKNVAHKEYVKKVFPDARHEEMTEHAKKLKCDLQNARRWAILIEGTHEDGHQIPGAGEGLLLAASPATIRTM